MIDVNNLMVAPSGSYAYENAMPILRASNRSSKIIDAGMRAGQTASHHPQRSKPGSYGDIEMQAVSPGSYVSRANRSATRTSTRPNTVIDSSTVPPEGVSRSRGDTIAGKDVGQHKPLGTYFILVVLSGIFVFEMYKMNWKFAPSTENPLLGPR
jgi:hypothetical protein